MSPAEPVIRTVRYLGAAARADGCPEPGLPEIAFAGRSNVGKSALLNALAGRRGLARVSSTPGRTQLLHFFELNGSLVFVDLPGYGYAAVSRELRHQWKGLVEGYLEHRSVLRAVVVILDVRRDPGDEERDLLAWLDARGLPAIVVATKCDKIAKAALFGRLRTLRAAITRTPVAFAAPKGFGRDEVWAALLARLADGERRSFAGAAP